MTGRLRMAVAAAFATVLTSSSLLPLVHNGNWIAKAIGAVVFVAAVGEGARRVSVPRPLIGTIQLVVLIPYLLLVLVPDASGPLPTPDALRAFGDLLNQGGDDIRGFAPPVPDTDGMAAILVTVVGGVAVLVDVIAVTYGQAAAAGLPLLALYSVPAALADSGLGWGVFLVAALAYLVLLIAEGRERLVRWGRPLSQPGPRRGPTGPQRPWVRGSGRIGLATLAVAVLVPAVVPMTANRLADRDSGKGGSDHITTINPVVDLKDELNRPENVDLLTYTTDAPDPDGMYLRIAALDVFDGNAWQPSEQALTDVTRPLPTPRGLTPGVSAGKVTTEIKAVKNYRQGSLPMPYAASEVKVKGNWRYEDEGRLLLGDSGQTTEGLNYSVVSLDIKPTADQLRAAGGIPPEMEKYRGLPPAVRQALAATTMKVAGYGTPFDQAVRIEKWFTESGEFRYDLQVPKGNGRSQLENFLQAKVGYCEQYASAMAVMARILNIPSRVAVGFVPGHANADGSYTVGSRDAHAWPELYFAGVGWVRFEPTPSRGTSPAYTDDAAPVSPTTQPATSAPATASSAPSSRDPRCKLDECESKSPSASAAPAKHDSDGDTPRNVLIGVGAGALVLLLLAMPMLLRQRVRHRRLAALGRDAAEDGVTRDPGDAVLGAWQEILDTARDLGIRVPTSETPRQLTVRLGDALPDDADTARDALPRIALAAEQILYAPEAPQRTVGLAEDVRVVRAALLAAAGRGTRFRATVLPGSTFRRGTRAPEQSDRGGPEPEPA
ncbi:transglutaminase TgpA family protein [Uniformispora flossi]|uniref:transglutaminase TgpA family protein n=1 Tax=Uniformispora flossi TaxID=3390723 RepID=UPI003C2BDB90